MREKETGDALFYPKGGVLFHMQERKTHKGGGRRTPSVPTLPKDNNDGDALHMNHGLLYLQD